MSSETAIGMIETVKKKLQKYITMEQTDKVQEYLLKLQNTLITSTLLRETKIDVLVGQLAVNNKTPYYSTAKSLLKKWHNKNLLAQTTNSSKVKTITNTNKTVGEKKFSVKRKSLGDDETHSNTLSESHSSDECTNGDRDQSSSSVKKRKVLSLAEYVGNKKPKTTSSSSSSSTADSTDNKLTDTQIQEIYAQFNANGEEFAAIGPDLASTVNKKLIQSNRNDFIANGQHPKIIEKYKTDHDDIWEEDDDDDEIDNNQQQIIKPPIKNIPPVNNIFNSEQVKKSTTKAEDYLLSGAVASSMASLEHSQPSSRPSHSQSIVPPPPPSKKSADTYNFLRSKQGRQAIYSGKRTTRTNIPSLQDLCVETLKDNVDIVCRTHFNRLPYDVVKPILDSATPEQLHLIIDSNPDYVDDAESLWQHFCLIHFKDSEREECESYYELYQRKFDEKEERLQRITQLAKRKKEEKVDTTRQTKPLNMRPITTRQSNNANKLARQVVGLPPSKPLRGQAKTKKPAMAPLLKKALKIRNGRY